MAPASAKPAQDRAPIFIPREHGAIAMLLTPFLAAAILLRHVYWPELVALLAIACAFGMKDPLVAIARQRFVWKQEHAEAKAAKRWVVVQSVLLAACGIALVLVRDWRPFVCLFLGSGAFTVLAIALSVRNRQRSEWFQAASAAALSSTSIVACLSAGNVIPKWCWLLWFLSALQSAAGIFAVHARLDARIAARKGQIADTRNRRAAFVCQLVLFFGGILFAFQARPWIAGALFFAAIGYVAELTRQKNPESLRIPLKRVGAEALGLSILYTVLIIVGLWQV